MNLMLWALAAVVATIGDEVFAQAACSENTATSRSQWCDNFSIKTNYYDEAPDTGITREYYFNLEQVTASPDGYPRTVYAINGSIPGPTIFADWGDTVKVHIANSLVAARNGTSIHFHGIRQNYTNQMDGVPSITECPVPPNGSTTYTWRATQFGTSWYHSHIGLQAWEGVAGSIVIDGPATTDYDYDIGPLLLSDWSHRPVDELYSEALTSGPPSMTNGLINGTNTWTNGTISVGKRFSTSVTSGKSYRLRLINGAIDSHFKFSIDNHTLTVIAADFVPIVPYSTNTLDIAMGQRYDIIVNADQAETANDFWIRAIPQAACSNNANADDIRGIFHYGSSQATPDTTGYNYTDGCIDELMDNLVPYVPLEVGNQSRSDDEEVALSVSNVFLWTLDSISFNASWSNPTLLQLYNNNTDFTKQSHVILLEEANIWEYVVIHSAIPISHPIHLHGHDFFVLAQGTGTYNASNLSPSSNPPRRDVALLPAGGYLVLAFKTDNPGAWLMHCHIGWHTNMGLALHFVEQYDIARKLIDYDRLSTTCQAWAEYTASENMVQPEHDEEFEPY